MSRHVIVDRPDFQLVLGFDHSLQSFFGQVFDRSNPRREGIAIAGWPTESGLGTRRPAGTHVQAIEDAGLLMRWALDRLPEAARDEANLFLLGQMRPVLMREWKRGTDFPTPAIPDVLKRNA